MLYSKDKTCVLMVRISSSMMDRINLTCRETGMTVSELVRSILNREVVIDDKKDF